MSMIRRGRDTWRFVTDIEPDPVTNKRRQASTTFHGKAADAKIAHATWLIETRGPDAAGLAGTSVTFGELLARYLATIKPTVAKTTYQGREKDVRLYLAPAIGPMPLRDLKSSHLDELYRRLLKPAGDLEASTVGNVHATARHALALGVRWEWTPRNVAESCTPIRVPHRAPWSPDQSDVDRILEHLKTADPPMYVFTELVLMTGARPAEIAAVRWCDVDLDAGMLDINASIERGPDRRRKETKTGRARQVTLDDDTVSMLKKWRAETGMGGEQYVFSNDANGKAPWPDSRRRLSSVRRELGITAPVTFRSERHYHATHLIANGVDPVTVARRLGHANPAMTLNVYSSAVPKNDRAAAELLRAMRKGTADA